ncbi:MAG: Crp/Fnr family transcriptional regulator [Betaproteobacteria bacterium]|nr:Crp/Fnr family transcriptional regulator [Betaproteobacteria bacterium]MDH5220695.1 Crp/Fnr family transcriptional regulator [Betaproteobacteria bacterium]MDH5349705.1 Crp/Fnr family transcriptional regulator [Betaproteobacteria bacterium]
MQQGIRSAPTAIRPFRDRRILEALITRLPAFDQLARPEVDELAGYSQLRVYRRGATIAARGEPLPGVVALVEGSAKLTLRSNNGEERIARLLEAGDSFGFAAVLLERDCPVDLVALSNCVVATIPSLPVRQLMGRNAGFAVALARTLAERVLLLVGELEASAQHSSLQRLACYLDSRAAQADGNGAWVVRLPATKSTIAARLGVKKETMSRLLRELTSRGLVEVAGPQIAILDRAGLAALAGGRA